MSTHPYWAYEAVPGSLSEEREKKALAEGRRVFALQQARQWDDTPEGAIAAARLFERYLEGEPVEDVNGAPLEPVPCEPWEENTGPADRGAL